MSKRKDIIRVGDRVKIVVPDVVVRVGYPLTKAAMMEKQTPEQIKAIEDMFLAFGVKSYPDKDGDFLKVTMTDSVADRLLQRIRYTMAGIQLRQEGWGGKERRIHTHTIKELKGKLATVDAKRVVKTGDYHHGYSGCDYWGEYDYEPSYLSNEKTHVLYKLYVDGYGSWWSESREDGTFFQSDKDDYKDIEIERCNLVKIDPKNPPTDDPEDFEPSEHPSGLSGEHSVVLDAIHQECLRNR